MQSPGVLLSFVEKPGVKEDKGELEDLEGLVSQTIMERWMRIMIFSVDT